MWPTKPSPGAEHGERIRVELVSVSGLSLHAAAKVRHKRGASTPSGVGQWHPTTVARSRSGLRITDTFGFVRDDLTAELNDELVFVTEKLIDFIRHFTVGLRAWNSTIAMGCQPDKANAEYLQELCQQLENALVALQTRCGGKVDVARNGRQRVERCRDRGRSGESRQSESARREKAWRPRLQTGRKKGANAPPSVAASPKGRATGATS
jgi:hypothetical protein